MWCSGLRKRYGKQLAVEDVSFEVRRGEVVGLLGPNGAGKTSIIKMLLGLVRPDAGEVLLLGQPGSDPAARTRVGYLPELFRYQPWLTPLEVLALHVRLSGLERSARGSSTTAWSSSGWAVASTTARAASPRACSSASGWPSPLSPIPSWSCSTTSALDPLGRADVRDIVLELRTRGVALLLNSHLIGEVERVGDWWTVALPVDGQGAAVPDLVAAGARVHAVEPGRVSLEERLLGILRDGADARASGAS